MEFSLNTLEDSAKSGETSLPSTEDGTSGQLCSDVLQKDECGDAGVPMDADASSAEVVPNERGKEGGVLNQGETDQETHDISSSCTAGVDSVSKGDGMAPASVESQSVRGGSECTEADITEKSTNNDSSKDESGFIDENSSPTMAGQSVSSTFTIVEVGENSTNVDMDESSNNAHYPVYVSTLQEAEEVLHRFENNTKSRFCVWRCPKDFGICKVDVNGKRIYWHEFVIEDRITVKSNGIPFVMMGRKVYDCHHGRDRNIALKQKAKLKREENDVKKRNVTIPSRKVDCPARVVFCDIVYFPEYKLVTGTKHYRAQIAKTIRQHFTEGTVDLKRTERRIYLSFPSAEDHKGHPAGKFTKTCQRVDPRVSSKIAQLVELGVASGREMKQLVDNHISKQLFPGRAKPFHSNRRYFPTMGVIRVKMYNAYILKRLSILDLENVEEAMKRWQAEKAEDKFYYRPYAEVKDVLINGTIAITVEEEDEDELRVRQKISKQSFIFVHQSSFQRRLLERYGNYTCFLDPVYRTVKYALPMYFVTVKTNVDYQVVATIVLQDERRDSAKEAIELLKSWNPHWKPKIFMVDNDSEEIASVEECFSGCEVLLSDFHREQTWDRWLSRFANGVLPHRDAVVEHMRSIARAASEAEFEEALGALEESDVWNSEYGKMFRDWFEDSWLNVKEGWVWCYKVDTVCSVPTTSNTLECQKNEFHHEQLQGQGETTLSELLKILVDTILPAKQHTYAEQNVPLSVTSSKYANLPSFYQGRPRQLADHVAECMTSAQDISPDDIIVKSSARGEFLVKSCESDIKYKFNFGNSQNLPRCECKDWSTTMLPCKHFIAIMRDFKEWNWWRFPESYRASPYLTLHDVAGVGSYTPPGDEVNAMALDAIQMNELLSEKHGKKSTGSRCRDLLTDINNLTYTVQDRAAVSTLLSTLDEALTKLRRSMVDDDLVVEGSAEANPKLVKCEGEQIRSKRGDVTNTPRKSSVKRTSEPGNQALSDIPNKSARLDATEDSMPGDMADDHALREVNNVELMTMGYISPLNSSNDGGASVNTGDIQGANEDPNTSLLFNTSHANGTHTEITTDQTNSSQADTSLQNVLEVNDRNDPGSSQPSDKKNDGMSQVEEKSDSDVVVVCAGTPSFVSKHEESLLLRNEMITHESINLAQALLRDAFPHLRGFQNVSRGSVQAFEHVSGDFIQILHDGDEHWVCTSSVAANGAHRVPAAVAVCNSMDQGFVAKFVKQQLASFLCIQNTEMKVVMKSVQQQTSPLDCGIFAVAFATALAFGQDPSKQRFDVFKMRPHLFECLKSMKMSPFPELKVGAGDIVLSKRKFYTIELFCSCRMPYEKPKSEADLMAQCGNCKEWFHQRCEKIALEIFKSSGLNFVCSSCIKKT